MSSLLMFSSSSRLARVRGRCGRWMDDDELDMSESMCVGVQPHVMLNMRSVAVNRAMRRAVVSGEEKGDFE